jgi:Glycosyltransferase family 87
LSSRILGALVLLLFLPGIYFTLADLLPAPHQEDLGAYFLAARALADGESPYDAHVADRLAAAAGVEYHSPYIYPPLLALVLRPLASLPYTAAAAIWFALSAAALLAALSLLRPVVQLPWRLYIWVCAAVFFLPPVHHTLQHGQITNFLLLLIAVGAVGSTRGAACVGIAAALKVFPAMLGAVYAVSRRLPALAAMFASGAALTLVAAAAAPAATADFFRRVAPRLSLERPLAPNNQSLNAVAARWFETHWFVTPIIDAPGIGRVVTYLGTTAVIALTLWALRPSRRSEGATEQLTAFSLAVTATLIVTPIVWDHYYVLLLLPVAVLSQRLHDESIRLLLLGGVALLLAHRYWPLAFALKSPVFMSAGLCGVVALWIALLRMLRYDRVCAVRPPPSGTRPSAI